MVSTYLKMNHKRHNDDVVRTQATGFWLMTKMSLWNELNWWWENGNEWMNDPSIGCIFEFLFILFVIHFARSLMCASTDWNLLDFNWMCQITNYVSTSAKHASIEKNLKNGLWHTIGLMRNDAIATTAIRDFQFNWNEKKIPILRYHRWCNAHYRLFHYINSHLVLHLMHTSTDSPQTMMRLKCRRTNNELK